MTAPFSPYTSVPEADGVFTLIGLGLTGAAFPPCDGLEEACAGGEEDVPDDCAGAVPSWEAVPLAGLPDAPSPFCDGALSEPSVPGWGASDPAALSLSALRDEDEAAGGCSSRSAPLQALNRQIQANSSPNVLPICLRIGSSFPRSAEIPDFEKNQYKYISIVA